MELSCTFSNETWNYPSAKIYTCKITSAMITKPGTLIKSINGTHQEGKTNNDVEGINFTGKLVNHFPRGLGKIFPSLTRLQIYNCGLKEISRRDFVGLQKFKVLYLWNNQIESLPDDLFVGMKNLQTIYLSDNKISCASSKLLKPIEKELKAAFFYGNTKINVDYDPLTPETLTELKQHLDQCDKPMSKPKNSSTEVEFLDFPETIVSKVELMWTTGKYSDFTILVGKSECKVHKNILGTQSKFFETMFDQEMEENLTGKMVIDVFGAEPVEEFLKFFYTGKVPSVSNALDVFKLAEMYEVPKLTDLCEEIIIENIDESNVVEVVQLANVHKRDDMKNSAVEMFKSIFPERNFRDSVFEDYEMLAKILEAKSFLDSMLDSQCQE